MGKIQWVSRKVACAFPSPEPLDHVTKKENDRFWGRELPKFEMNVTRVRELETQIAGAIKIVRSQAFIKR